MRLSVFIVLISLLCLSSLSKAQDGSSVYQFLQLTTSPRQAALGGNAQSMWDADPNMSYWNPALMNPKSHNKLSFNYLRHLSDIQMGTFSYVYQLNKHNFLSIHSQYLDYGDFIAADEMGNVNGSFTAKEAAVFIGYAYNLGDFFTFGTNVKYIHSIIESYTSYAIATDFGLVFHDIDYDTNISLGIRNLGVQIKPYDLIKEDLPVQVNLGISHKLEHVPLELTATLHDLQKFNISEREGSNDRPVSNARKVVDHLSIGAELFPGKGFNIRVGYNFKRGNELNTDLSKNFSGITFGFGFRVSAFRIDYAHAQYHSAGNTNHLGLSVDLERFFDRRRY